MVFLFFFDYLFLFFFLLAYKPLLYNRFVTHLHMHCRDIKNVRQTKLVAGTEATLEIIQTRLEGYIPSRIKFNAASVCHNLLFYLSHAKECPSCP